MTLIVCLDNDDGMLFNKRRQSRDVCVCDRILQIVRGNKLYMNAYSAKLFPPDSVIVTEAPLEDAVGNSFVFSENLNIAETVCRADQIIVYRWNRQYPSDVKFPKNILHTQFVLRETEEFPGKSHDVITEEVYAR